MLKQADIARIAIIDLLAARSCRPFKKGLAQKKLSTTDFGVIA
jgi:hypothetical protein